MPTQIIDLGEATPFDQLLIALVGKEKSGKSRLAATGRKPVLFFDFDGRAASVAGTKGVYAISYHDTVGYKQPDVFADFISKLTQLEQCKCDLSQLGFACEPGTVFAKTIVLDSMARMAKAAMRYILANGSKGITRTIGVSGMQINFPGGFDAWNAEMCTIEDCLLRVFALKTDVIAIFHEEAEESPESTPEHTIMTGKVGIFPARYKRLIGYFNEVWRIERQAAVGTSAQSAAPTVRTAPDYTFALGASCLNIDVSEAPNIEGMIAKHLSKGQGLTTTLGPSMPTLTAQPPIVSLVQPLALTETK